MFFNLYWIFLFSFIVIRFSDLEEFSYHFEGVYLFEKTDFTAFPTTRGIDYNL